MGRATPSAAVQPSLPATFPPNRQFKALQHYMDAGGSILMMLGEGGESRFDTNINYLLEQYGMSINAGMPLACVAALRGRS